MGGRMVWIFNNAHIGAGDEKLTVFLKRTVYFLEKKFEKILEKNFFQKHKIDFGGENKICLEK